MNDPTHARRHETGDGRQETGAGGQAEDSELLRRYAGEGSEDAFAELVRRQVNLVHSAALRQVNGDAHLAADVTQMVFTDLARKAAVLAQHRVLAGWLFTSTRYAAAKVVRTERRRAAREQEAQLMQDMSQDSAASLDWARVRPVLDEALGELSDPDREAILLRFFEGRDFAAVGMKLSVSDNTARMRVERALEKLRVLLGRRGIGSTTAALATVLGSQAVAAAPAGLAATVTGAALAGAGSAALAAAGAGTGAAVTFMSITKVQIGLAALVAVAGTTGIVLQASSNAELRREVAALRAGNVDGDALRSENRRLQRIQGEANELSGSDTDLKRLTDEAATLKTRLDRVVQGEQARLARSETFNLSSLDLMPRVRFQARPQYPAALRQAGITGTVVVEFIVDANGDAQSVYSTKSAIDEPAPGKPADVVRLSSFNVEGSGSPGANSGAAVPDVDPAEAAKLLEAAAIEAVAKWKFNAGRKGGRDVNTRMQVPIVFTLAKE